MRIDKLEVHNFKNYESLEISFKGGINLIVGENGSGKTSLLEAINVAIGGFFGDQESKMQRMIDSSEVRLYMANNRPTRSTKTFVSAYTKLIDGTWTRNFNAITNSNDKKEVRLISNYGSHILEKLSDPNNREIAPLIVYYSTQRLFKDASQSAKQKYDAAIGRRNGYLQCLRDNAIKGTLIEWLGNAVTRRATKQIQEIDDTDFILENVENAIKKVLAYFVEDFDESQLKIYQEPDFDFELFIQLNNQLSLPMSSYSDGFRNLIYLIIDLVWRASQLNPTYRLEELTALQVGTVTIDEIDLHLHPKWQAKSIGIIQKLFPNVQFFITTHSPTVMANFKERMTSDGANLDSIFMLENNTCREITASFFGRDINSVLENPMDAYTRAKEVQELIEEFDTITANEEAEDYDKAVDIHKLLGRILPGTDTEFIRLNEIVGRINAAKK